MNKILSWIVLLVGIYQVLALLIESVPRIINNTTWGWILGVVLVILGGWMLKQKD